MRDTATFWDKRADKYSKKAIKKLLGFAPYVRCLKVAELEEIITNKGFEILESDLYPTSPPSLFVIAQKP